ncbi:flagellar hook-associated protein 1 FlgK [Kineococcus radiotolerans]|uniref:Flagellar hook-associated protein 1 n=1 Tax=Kineococcus radiotolerans TaxID=131568 RepID=A0A7W4TJF1_KINRA|nr:flagellar hook-associated protein FlgK [Kineococcus radiotolerans]MBB2899683.1 flagellar hook-associated protein 1 FlgK [Kineococcus radiotolerans]
MSTFSGINTASRALGAAQRGMETTGQNIANVNTPGYSRQRVEQSSSVLNQTGQFTQKYVPGDGVVVNGLTRVSDALATATARQDSAAAQEQATAASIWSGTENAIGDTGASGLSENLKDLSSAWNDLASKAGTDGLDGARSLVLTRSETVATQIVGMNTQLEEQYTQLGLQAETLSTQATTIAQNVAKLNTGIRETLASGASANELMDQRDQLLNQLSDITGSRVVNRENGTVDVLVGNATLVTGDFSYKLEIGTQVSTTDKTPVGAGAERIGNQFVATIGGQAAGPVAGSLKATLDGANTTLVKQQGVLDGLATKLTNTVNKAYDGQFFKTSDPAFAAPVKASQLELAASTVRDSNGTSADRNYAKKVSTAFADVKTQWRTDVTNLAASTQSANNRAELSAQVSLKSSAVRDGVSGVNLDEEMTNLVAYQHAYSAAAKVLTTMDEALQSLLNMVR